MEPQNRRSDNPLRQFFRQPAIYIRLPSGGQGWPQGSIDLPGSGELAVYPMTAVDEITYKTPDALFNGEAVVSVIQSCVPSIRDAWVMPGTDVDTVLVAIRIASYGHSLDIGTQCPACSNEHEFGLDLRTVIDRLQAADYSEALCIGDLELYFRPLNYRELNLNSQQQFEQQKILQAVTQSESADTDKVKTLNEMMRSIMDLTLSTMASSISEIRTANAMVQEPQHILEFLTNCDRDTFNRVRDHMVLLRRASELQPLKLTCVACQHKYEQSFTLDMSRFFASGS